MKPEPMLRTALAGFTLALVAWLSAAWLTEGFQVWTAEGARRSALQRAPVAAPAAVLLDNGLALRSLLARPGQVTIASFMYTRCPGVCLALGSGMQQLQQRIAASGSGVRLLSISFDPAHDGTKQLQSYAALWHADAALWRFATVPERSQLQHLLAAWQVVVIADGLGGWDHNAALLVIDPQGRLVRVFDDTQADAALDFAQSLLQASRPALML